MHKQTNKQTNKQLHQLLIIEDCPYTCEGYKNLLAQQQELNTSFQLTFANTCDAAVTQIKTKPYDIVVLDLQLPVSRNKKFVCGEDLGLLIRQEHSDTKNIIVTNISEAIRISAIIKEIAPEGFIIKAKSDPKDLITAITDVCNDTSYYCKTVKEHLRNTNAHSEIDDYDRQILYYLSMGEKTKDLCKLIPLSHRAIEVRKTKLKIVLDINKDKNFNMIREAKKLGFV